MRGPLTYCTNVNGVRRHVADALARLARHEDEWEDGDAAAHHLLEQFRDQLDAWIETWECPAGGRHDWGILEEAGTGRTWAGCENCGMARPPEPDDLPASGRTYPAPDPCYGDELPF